MKNYYIDFFENLEVGDVFYTKRRFPREKNSSTHIQKWIFASRNSEDNPGSIHAHPFTSSLHYKGYYHVSFSFYEFVKMMAQPAKPRGKLKCEQIWEDSDVEYAIDMV